MEQLDLPAVSGDAPIVGPLGEISVRFVVFKKKTTPAKSTRDDQAGDDDETADSAQEINSYLEAPTHGRQHVVFLLNGQRHHSMDRGFIVHDLGKKYISKRTLIIVELEGLTREAKARLIQGSRSGFYEAEVFHRIKARLVALLKRDPDLERMEDEAEEELSRLQASDEDVHLALDQLIEEHNPFADHSAQTSGPDAAGKSNGVIIAHVGKAAPLNVVVRATEGDMATGPLLIGRNSPKTLRLRPNEQKQITLFSDPPEAWAHLTKIGFVMDPALEELKVTIDSTPEGSKVSFLYSPPTEDQDYPVSTSVRFFGGFNGSSEPRLFEQDIVIKPRTDRPPPPEPVLLDMPTQLRLRSRKPIKLLLGDADRHVMLQWDGKDELVNGLTPSWMLRVFCTSHPGYPAVTVTHPHKGRFEAVVPCPQDRAVFGPGTSMVFQAEAIGRGGKTLSIQFEAIVEDSVPPVDENGPRLSNVAVPLAGDRKPNYQIVEISEEKYGEIECPWGDAWDTSKAGAFIEPREKKPVILIVNVDHELYRQFMAQELKGKPAESTIKRQRTRYIAHICYYLYQMFLSQQTARPSATGATDSPTEPTDERNIQEINRVAKMLVRLMPMMH